MERYLEQIPMTALAVVVFVLMSIFMTTYEILKQLIAPEITLWQSHSVTIFFSAATATVLAILIGKRFNAVNRELARQMNQHQIFHKEVATLKEMLSRGQRLAETGSFMLDLKSGNLSWSPELFNLIGKSEENFSPTVEAIIERFHPSLKEQAQHLMRYEEGEERLREIIGEYKDSAGNHREVVLRTHVYNNDIGEPALIHGVLLLLPRKG